MHVNLFIAFGKKQNNSPNRHNANIFKVLNLYLLETRSKNEHLLTIVLVCMLISLMLLETDRQSHLRGLMWTSLKLSTWCQFEHVILDWKKFERKLVKGRCETDEHGNWIAWCTIVADTGFVKLGASQRYIFKVII